MTDFFLREISNVKPLVVEHLDIDDLEFSDSENALDKDPWCWDVTEADITVPMLRKRKDIKQAIEEGLKEAFPEKYQEDAVISDESIVEILNMDLEVKATIIEILLELTDCKDHEGETGYYPSISEYTCAGEILNIDKIIGFREAREAIPFKYEHLTTETISIIYSNPHILPIISRMKKEQITDKFVRSLTTKK